MERIRDIYNIREVEHIAVILTYTNDFTKQSLAYEVTTKLTRTLAYEMNVPIRGIGEYQLDVLEQEAPKLLIVPSPHNFDNRAFDKVLEIVEKKGITVLFTG